MFSIYYSSTFLGLDITVTNPISSILWVIGYHTFAWQPIELFESLTFSDLLIIRWRSEKTKIGRMLSGALVSTLVALAASNLGIISCEAPAYSVVLGFLLPLAVPLLLFRADLRKVIQSTGTLLLAFLLGSGKITWSHHIFLAKCH